MMLANSKLKLKTMIQTMNNGPSAHVTVNRNRLKYYGNTVYLKSGTNFEIELWNPTTSRLLTSIEIDGKPISSTGLVINPGQRVYLERWLDEARKFLFSTYEAENSPEGLAATKSNGNIKISFFNEYVPPKSVAYDPLPLYYPNSITSNLDSNKDQGIVSAQKDSTHSNPIGNLSKTSYFSSTLSTNTSYLYTTTFNTTNTNSEIYGTNSLNHNFSSFDIPYMEFDQRSSTMDFMPTELEKSAPNKALKRPRKSPETIETGRTEMGSISNQNFDETVGNFNVYPSVVFEWNILPESRKPKDADKIRNYCTCSNRIRSASWKFCPSCGEKL